MHSPKLAPVVPTADRMAFTSDTIPRDSLQDLRRGVELAMSNILPNLLSLLVAATLLLAGCSQQSPMEDAQNAAKAAYRKQAFDECMHELPAGPRTTHYNDWSEVVDACDNASYYITNTRYP